MMDNAVYTAKHMKEEVKKAKAPYQRIIKDSIIIRNNTMVKRIRELARKSHMKPCDWAFDVLDLYIREHRSNKPPVDDPSRHTERPGVDEHKLHKDCFVGDKEGL